MPGLWLCAVRRRRWYLHRGGGTPPGPTRRRLALVGVLVGGIAAAGAARLVDSLIYGVSSIDPLAYGAAAGLLILVTFAANLLPALTASRVDPVRALATE